MSITALMNRFGQACQLWSPNRGEANATAGLNDPEWLHTGTDTTAIVEELDPVGQVMAGAAVESKTARLYLSLTDGQRVLRGDILVDADGQAWGIVSEPVRFRDPLPHYEAMGEYSVNPPEAVFPYPNEGAPTNGVTLADVAANGRYLLDTVANRWYRNTGTLASPTWEAQ